MFDHNLVLADHDGVLVGDISSEKIICSPVISSFLSPTEVNTPLKSYLCDHQSLFFFALETEYHK